MVQRISAATTLGEFVDCGMKARVVAEHLDLAAFHSHRDLLPPWLV
ncbi:MAG: hypothetical protein MUF54_19050 [Polyangiaceae bacterium]|nr:hypothetical protein [Polyangiaceae bacterium]